MSPTQLIQFLKENIDDVYIMDAYDIVATIDPVSGPRVPIFERNDLEQKIYIRA